MSIFTDSELQYLTTEAHLGRLATVGPDGMPHVTPVGWSLTEEASAVRIGGIDLPATKKYRDVARNGRAALVIDDVLPPWRPRGIEIRGRAEAVEDPEPHILLHPERVVGWGLDGQDRRRNARDVA